jgi:hypothetical protein
VDVYANTAGNRTIEVLDASGAVVQSAVKNLPAGKSTVSLNFSLGAGTGYLIKISSATVDLYRNSGGATFPYTTNVITITGNTASGNPTYYYYFYNWKVQQNPCMSPSTVVSAIDTCATGMGDISTSSTLDVFPNPGHGIFTANFQTEINDNYTVKIISSMGQTVFEESLNKFSGSYNRKFDISEYGKGMYMLSISNSENKTVKKIIIH